MIRLLAFVLSAAGLAAGCRTLPASESAATVYVVRHAERLDASDDPPLNAAGTARAAVLADSLDRWGKPETVWSTRYLRAQQTVQPTARHARVDIRTYGGTPDAAADARALVSAVRATIRPGQRALVVGHSNTVPTLLNAFDGGNRPDLHHADYDGLYVVTLRGDRATVRRVRFGADDGTPDPG